MPCMNVKQPAGSGSLLALPAVTVQQQQLPGLGSKHPHKEIQLAYRSPNHNKYHSVTLATVELFALPDLQMSFEIECLLHKYLIKDQPLLKPWEATYWTGSLYLQSKLASSHFIWGWVKSHYFLSHFSSAWHGRKMQGAEGCSPMHTSQCSGWTGHVLLWHDSLKQPHHHNNSKLHPIVYFQLHCVLNKWSNHFPTSIATTGFMKFLPVYPVWKIAWSP